MNPLNIIKEFNTEQPFGEAPKYTLREARDVFLISTDEYSAALKIAGVWEKWEAMLGSVRFTKHVQKWRDEKGLKNQSEILAMLWTRARNADVSAQKILFDYNFKELKGKGPGRPMKVKVEDGTRKADIIKAAEKHIKLAINNDRSDSKAATR